MLVVICVQPIFTGQISAIISVIMCRVWRCVWKLLVIVIPNTKSIVRLSYSFLNFYVEFCGDFCELLIFPECTSLVPYDEVL